MNLEKVWEQLQLFVSTYAISILGALLIFFLGKWLARRVANLTHKLMQRQHIDETLIRFLDNILYYVLLMVVLMAAADQLGINTSSFLAIFGAAGLAVGLALKDSLGNFASGVMLVFFRPFKIGDYVTAGGTTGTVDGISIFNTTFVTPDNQKMIVPNGAITNAVITNFTANDTRRLDLVFGISYGDDLLKARAVFEEALRTEARILKEPEPMIVVGELADSSVNFYVRPWVKTEDYWSLKFALIEKIKLALDQAGITIPFPQTDVYLHKIGE